MTEACDRFAGSTVVVTGSTRGIGEATAHRFAAEGAFVVVTGRTRSDGERVVADIEDRGGKARFVKADMRSKDAIRVLFDDVYDARDEVDVLVNNAAVQTETTSMNLTEEEWSLVNETDFRSYWLCAKYALELMPSGGAIVNVSSNHAFSTMPGVFPYNAVKAGINGMTRAMALELGPLGIRVNTVNPGWVEVDRTADELEATDREHIERIHPLGRVGRPAEVASTVAFLASDDASFVTGASLTADGGRGAVMQDDEFLTYRRSME